MSHWLIIGVALLVICFGMYRSNDLLKKKAKLENEVNNIYGPMEIIEDITYQGGFPPMPKPARLNLGLTGSGLVLFDKNGRNGRIEYDRMRRIEKFTTKNQRKNKYSLMAWGPLALVLNRPSYKHFVVVKYRDINNESNNMVVQLKTREKKDEFYDSLESFRQQRPSKGYRKVVNE